MEIAKLMNMEFIPAKKEVHTKNFQKDGVNSIELVIRTDDVTAKELSEKLRTVVIRERRRIKANGGELHYVMRRNFTCTEG